MSVVLPVIASIVLSLLPGQRTPIPYARARGNDTCSLSDVSTTRITLADGATATIDASGVVSNRNGIFIVGSLIHVWNANARHNSPPRPDQSAIAIYRDSIGIAHLIPSPMPDARYPRVADLGDQGWGVLFVTGHEGSRTNALAFDSARVWYGVFDGVRWRKLEDVAEARGAILQPAWTSELVSTRKGIAFAYSFDRSIELHSNAPGNQGLVLLLRRHGKWVSDTLKTWEAPRAAQLVPRSDGNLIAILAQSYFAARRPHRPALFSVPYEERWGEQRMLLADSARELGRPMIGAVSTNGISITWRSRPADASTETLEWGRIDATGELHQQGAIAQVRPLDQPAVLGTENGRTVILVRNADSQSEMRGFVASRAGLTDMGIISVPLSNFETRGAALGNDRLLIVTGTLGRQDNEPPASSYMTEMVLRCPKERL